MSLPNFFYELALNFLRAHVYWSSVLTVKALRFIVIWLIAVNNIGSAWSVGNFKYWCRHIVSKNLKQSVRDVICNTPEFPLMSNQRDVLCLNVFRWSRREGCITVSLLLLLELCNRLGSTLSTVLKIPSNKKCPQFVGI